MGTYYYYHPLGENYANADKGQKGEANTYGTHGIGKLDMGRQYGEPIYSMADGTVTFNGTYSEPAGCTAICIETNCGAIAPVTMRYLHGDWDESLTVGTQVKRGQKIGTENGNGAGGPSGTHLHIDISNVGNGFEPVYGTLNGNTYTLKSNPHPGQSYNIDVNINNDLINYWKSRYSAGGDNIGYNWLIFASEFIQYQGNESNNTAEGALSGDVNAYVQKYSERIKQNGGSSYSITAHQMCFLTTLYNALITQGVCRNTGILLCATAYCEDASVCDPEWLSSNGTTDVSKLSCTWGPSRGYLTLWAWDEARYKNITKCIASYVRPSGKFSEKEMNFPNEGGGFTIQSFMITGLAQRKSGCVQFLRDWDVSTCKIEGANIVVSQGMDAYMSSVSPNNVSSWKIATRLWEHAFEGNGDGSDKYCQSKSPYVADALNYAWS